MFVKFISEVHELFAVSIYIDWLIGWLIYCMGGGMPQRPGECQIPGAGVEGSYDLSDSGGRRGLESKLKFSVRTARTLNL